MDAPLKAPFPWFGGKARAAKLIWSRLGRCRNYVEPFAGSLAVLLARPQPFDGPETVNDVDGFIANVWRAIAHDPDAVADHADWPVNENDCHAREAWIVDRRATLTARLEGDPEYFDAKIAGWWLHGVACYIGSGFADGKGPWKVVEAEDDSRQLVHLGDQGQGVNRQLVHLGDQGRGDDEAPDADPEGLGVNRKFMRLADAGVGVHRESNGRRDALFSYMQALSARLRRVRVACGDWSRVMGETPMLVRGKGFTPVGVLLDPPYDEEEDVYSVACRQIAAEVRDWALAHGDDSRYRIAICGYTKANDMPPTWECVAGKAGGGHGYGGQTKGEAGYANAGRERIWFSPHCKRRERQESLFADNGSA